MGVAEQGSQGRNAGTSFMKLSREHIPSEMSSRGELDSGEGRQQSKVVGLRGGVKPVGSTVSRHSES
jgi:hypothetical protein